MGDDEPKAVFPNLIFAGKLTGNSLSEVLALVGESVIGHRNPEH